MDFTYHAIQGVSTNEALRRSETRFAGLTKKRGFLIIGGRNQQAKKLTGQEHSAQEHERMRRRTKILLLLLSLPPVVAIATICFLDADSAGRWPKEKTWMQLMAAETAEEAIHVFGRVPDVIIPPNPGATNGIEQWIWTNNKRTNWELHQEGWVKLYVSKNGLIFDLDDMPAPPLILTWQMTARDWLESAGFNPGQLGTTTKAHYDASLARCNEANRFCLRDRDGAPPSYQLSSFLVAKPHLAADGSPKIAEIKIVGNQVTMDRIILRLIDCQPGQQLAKTTLGRAQQALIDSGIFHVDRDLKILPSVSAIDPNGPNEFKDVLVQVDERK